MKPAVAILFVACISALSTHIAALSQRDIDVLNFALNLECLEAEFYSYAAYGYGLSRTLRGGGPTPVGGRKALLSPEALTLARDLAVDEIRHVRFLRMVLGRNAVACPQINIGSAFVAAANAAVGATLPVAFSPYGSDVVFYHAAFIFEDVGATAYKGAATLIDDPAVLSAAAGILGTESYHAGAIRERLIAIRQQYVFPYSAQVGTIIKLISDLRAAVGGGKDRGLTPLVPADSYSIIYGRNTSEVLNIVYLNGKKTPGGFFPRGLNGRIR